MNAGQSGTTDSNDLWNLDRQDYVALVTELRAENASLAESAKEQWAMAEASMAQLVSERDQARADLAQARAERDEAVSEASKSWAFVGNVTDSALDLLREIERQRRTIRALVVAARAIHRTLWQALDQYEVNDRRIVRDMRQHVIGLNIEQAKQSGQQAGE